MRTAYCFDLDGTVTSTEILPCIASELGVAAEIATLTRVTMDGLISFEDSMRLRCLVLGQVPYQRVHEIIDQIPVDESIADFIRTNQDNSFIVTGNLDVWIDPLLTKIGGRHFRSRASQANGRLALDHILDKGFAVEEVRRLGFDRIIAIGDGANDLAMFRAADIGVAYGGVHPPAPATVQAANFVVNSGDVLCSLLRAL